MPRRTQPARLDQVHAILSNGKQHIRSIAEVAAEHDFVDLAEFNRLFKARHGISPSVVRKSALNPGGRGRRR
jgi:AraC-like DNA-binding protein